MLVAPARRRGLAAEVADNIREAIFSGVYPLGASLREVELSATLEVSRGPVREALLMLEREGLVRSEWHRGTTVTTLTAEDIAELHTLRGSLEQLAVERVMARADEADLSAIADVVRAMERAHTEHEMVRCDIEFHDAVYQAARHSRLSVAWQAIRSQVHLLLVTRIGVDTEHYLADMPVEHQALLDALRAGDADVAVALFAEHRAHAFDILTAGAQSSGDRDT
jgi:DNA-binding GntR family transcriptional regulator